MVFQMQWCFRDCCDGNFYSVEIATVLFDLSVLIVYIIVTMFEKCLLGRYLTIFRFGSSKYDMRKIKSANSRSGVLMRDKTFEMINFKKEKNPPQDIWAVNKDPKYTDVEEVTGHWQYVERLFPKLGIGEVPGHSSSTGWKPPRAEVPDLPYFIPRTRNHMLPVYLGRVTRDFILVTKIRKIQGDIWKFEFDLKDFLKRSNITKFETQVNEICCTVNVKDDHVEEIKQWLYETGF